MGQSFPPVTTRGTGTLLRYDMRADRAGWTVHDVLEGWTVCLGGVSLVGLPFEKANEMVDMLNRHDLEIERTARRLVSTAAYGVSKAARSQWSS